ncbi:hypothetical protein DYB26_015567 [Aphanomyces astaci]|uniref:PWWP domain-containing protein n=1 Tax=Aphanomyces astaci TaxID=112090 RepID=A0A3R6WT07_APHAT|nr:hypothetical protein DYB26_015567 [Aphanomyces astaci]
MAWARRSDTLSASSPWWPVYVCDPERLQPTLEHLGASIKTTMEGGRYLTTSFYIHAGNRHQKLLVTAKQYPNSLRLVYLFGGTPDVCAKNMARWRGPDHDLLLKGHPAHAVTGRVVREFARAVRDATKYAATDAYTRLLPDMAESDMVPRYIPPQVPPYSAFLKRDPRQRLLPYMVPTDMNLALPAPEKYAIPLNQMVWALSDTYPWLPAFVCDPEHLPCDLRALGAYGDVVPFQNEIYFFITGIDARKMLAKAQAKPDECWLVYYFGSRTLYVVAVVQSCMDG